MDELEFRRRVYANPDTTDAEVVKAAQQDPGKRAFWNEQKKLDRDLKQAAKVEIPDDLAHKLIWQQSAYEFARHKRRSRWYMALAASLAFTIGLSFTLFTRQPLNLGNEVLAHMVYAEDEQAHSAVPVDLRQVNAKLASFGASFTDMIGDVEVVNYCHLQSVRSLHLILNTQQGKMSVFVVPNRDDISLPDNFADDRYHGQGVHMQRASIMVVGHKNANLLPMLDNVKQRIQFST
ncbi:DUF3379 family protein [Alteromonas halophila]|uniref:DUF3379 domain-containing protein n=1 Tax=Alteromonas halophila TaxID=516698 RepID=A0A918JCD4_9ALTE|nr:DUF3379 family protein [Alteromonas halophila]GGW74471.1 hypothetical protein GCM10007391_03050 [Alteromonas halophila]